MGGPHTERARKLAAGIDAALLKLAAAYEAEVTKEQRKVQEALADTREREAELRELIELEKGLRAAEDAQSRSEFREKWRRRKAARVAAEEAAPARAAAQATAAVFLTVAAAADTEAFAAEPTVEVASFVPFDSASFFPLERSAPMAARWLAC